MYRAQSTERARRRLRLNRARRGGPPPDHGLLLLGEDAAAGAVELGHGAVLPADGRQTAATGTRLPGHLLAHRRPPSDLPPLHRTGGSSRAEGPDREGAPGPGPRAGRQATAAGARDVGLAPRQAGAPAPPVLGDVERPGRRALARRSRALRPSPNSPRRTRSPGSRSTTRSNLDAGMPPGEWSRGYRRGRGQPSSSSRSAASMNCWSSGLNGARCPQMVGMGRVSAPLMNPASYSQSTGGK